MKRIIGYLQPLLMIFIIDAIAFSLLYLYKKTFDIYILGVGLTVFTIICIGFFLNLKKDLGDEYLFIIVSMLASIGIIMLYRLNREVGMKQVVWFAIGVVLFFASHFISIKIKRLDRLIFLYFAGAIALFLLTLIFGTNIKGAKNWIIIAGQSVQPSEFIKILFILFLASYYKNPERLDIKFKILPFKISGKYVMTTCAYVFMGFLILQKEWGSTLLLFLVYFSMLFVFDNNKTLLILNTLAALPVGILGYLKVYHVRVRIDTWLDPWKDIADKGYQITQSLFAIGEGGFFGEGLGLGSPDMIPEVIGDFIYSAICEELGIFTGIAVVLLFFLLVYRGFKISMAARDTFAKSLALGITLMFGFQTFIIIGGVIKLIPLTGITLPFISYGGSSLTASYIALGILHAVSNNQFETRQNNLPGGAL